MQAVGKLKELDQFALKKGRQSIAQVAVLLDEDTIPHISNNSKMAMGRLRRMLGHHMDSAGAPWDCYLFSDIDRIDFSKYKLVILANSYILNDSKVRDIKKYLYNSDRTVLYLYQPGQVDDTPGEKNSHAYQLTGMNFSAANLVEELDFHPAWIAFGDGVQALRKFSNKQTAIARKAFPSYRVCFTSTTGLDAKALALIYKNAGVHCYAQPGDLLFACGNFLGIYSRDGGERTINLSQEVDVVRDVWDNSVIDTKTSQFMLHLPDKPSCTILYVGH
jgi:hypothetical protein